MIQSFLLFSLIFPPPGNHLTNPCEALNKFYLDWRKITVQSLEQRAHNTTDSLKRNTYLNRINAVSIVTQKEGPLTIDTLALRYLLLKDHFTNIISSKGDVFIIEIKTMASTIIFTDLIVYKGVNHVAKVDALRFNGKKWVVIKNFTCDTNFLLENLSNYFFEDGSGINFDETMITKVSKGKLTMSEYYITKSLSSKCGLQNIFDHIGLYYYKN
ncbi:hypothetical protein [Chitinophaga sp.]|uniref:hypothetical protein n=1 Tax=Chitinophaga sp. TaxID=1869181 RepID=UPI0031CF701F